MYSLFILFHSLTYVLPLCPDALTPTNETKRGSSRHKTEDTQAQILTISFRSQNALTSVLRKMYK